MNRTIPNVDIQIYFFFLKVMEDKLDMIQFRLFLRILRMTYSFYQTFNYIDSDGVHIINRENFCSDETK